MNLYRELVRKRTVFFVYFISIFFLVNSSFSQTKNEQGLKKNEIERINKLKNEFALKKKGIKEAREALEVLDLENLSLEENLEALDSKKKEFQTEHNKLSDELLSLEDKRAEIKEHIASLMEEAGLDYQIINQRLVSFYKLSRQSSFLSYFLSSKSAENFYWRDKLLEGIVQKDLKLIEKLDRQLLNQQSERLELLEIERHHRETLDKLGNLTKKIDSKLKDKRTLQKSINNKKSNFEQELLVLDKSSRQLEKTLVSVMGETSNDKTQFKKINLAKLKGKLRHPVRGEIVQTFGKKRHQDFSDVLLVKGIEYFVRPGSEVKAIAPGEVVLRQKLPEYGNVLILDHGLRYYSLYGRLANYSVKQGDVVESGQVLADVGEVEIFEETFEPSKEKRLKNSDSNFYFELRQRGKAIDPTNYFTKNSP